MKNVAAAAGVARSTVYRNFPGPVELLVATVKREMGALNEQIRDKLAGFEDPVAASGNLQDAVRPEILVEWVYRLLLSFLTLPSNWIRRDDELRATLHALLVPVLLQ